MLLLPPRSSMNSFSFLAEYCILSVNCMQGKVTCPRNQQILISNPVSVHFQKYVTTWNSNYCSKFFYLLVPPMMNIPHQLVGAPLGYSFTLKCTIEAHPAALTYWTRSDQTMVHQSDQFVITETVSGCDVKRECSRIEEIRYASC